MSLVLADILNEKHVALDLPATSRDTALRKLVDLLAINKRIRDPDKFLEQVLAREQLNPTVVEHDIAFPHARTDLADKVVLAAGRSLPGVSFGPAGEQARLIFLIGVPQRLISDYLVCVGALARLLKKAEVRQQLLGATTPTEFYDALRVTDETRFD